MCRDCKSEANIHPTAIVFHRRIEEFLDFRKGDDLVEFAADLAPAHTEDRTVEKDVFAASKFRMKTGANLKQARDPPAQAHAPRSRLRDAAQNLKYGAFAGTVLADDADDFTALHIEAHVLEGPEFLDLVALDDLPATKCIDRLAGEVARFTSDHVPQRRVAPALSRSMANQVAL